MERDRENPWLPMNSFNPSSSTTPPPPTHNSILHLQSQLAQLSLSSTDGAAAPPPPQYPFLNNFPYPAAAAQSDSWLSAVQMAIYERQYAANYAALDLQRLRVNSAVNAASSPLGSYSGLGLGLSTSFFAAPTRVGHVDPYEFPESLMFRRRSMLGNSDLYASNVNQFQFNNPVPAVNPADLLERSFLYNRNPSNKNRTINNNRRRNNNHHNHNHTHNSDYNNGVMEDNIQSMMEMRVPSWDEVRGRVAFLSTNHNGSALLQCMLAKGDHLLLGLEIAISEVNQQIAQIVTNESGVKFFIKLLDFCDDRHVSEILRTVVVNTDQFLEICLHSQGTRAVQSLLKKVNKYDQNQRAIVAAVIVPMAWTLSKDCNGSYVMVACLKAFEGFNDVIAPILEEIGNHCMEIAKDKSGCCVLQQCLAAQVGRQRILSVIVSNAYQLSAHEYGNYVVQFVIGMRNDLINSQVIKKLEGSFASLSKCKHGSHVVEKCLKDARDDKVKLIIKELIEDPNFVEILQDQVGNYVAQTALHRCKAMSRNNPISSLHSMLAGRIQSYYAFLHSHPCGKRVLFHTTKCDCKLGEFGFNVDF